jgi:hypothetical protein
LRIGVREGVTIGRRITFTVAAGVLLALATFVAEDRGFPTAGVNAAIDSPVAIVAIIVFLATPLAVGRWWVLFSLAGPALALLIMNAANVQVSLDDGTGPAINYRTIFQFIIVCAAMLLVVGVRSLFVTPQSDQPG